MINKLKNIASIQTGVYGKTFSIGNIHYIQGSMINNNGELIIQQNFPKLIGVPNLEKHQLKENDILFMAKGERNISTLYTNSKDESVASTSFFVIRLMNENLLPEYLTWYLNALYESGKMKTLLKGTHIPSISKKALEEIEIPVPPISLQVKLLDIQKRWNMEKKLTYELINKKELFYNKYLINLAKNEYGK